MSELDHLNWCCRQSRAFRLKACSEGMTKMVMRDYAARSDDNASCQGSLGSLIPQPLNSPAEHPLTPKGPGV